MENKLAITIYSSAITAFAHPRKIHGDLCGRERP